MDPPLLTLSVAVIFVLCSVIVESQRIVDRPPPLVFSPRPPPSPPLFPSRPLRPPPPPRRHTRLHLPPPPRRRTRLHLPPPPPHRRHDPQMKPPPPRRKPDLNLGKKIGLTFIGVAMVLQVCVVGFLLISRRRFLKHENLR
ncbi:Unknown protein [Striga hermonthica]|uniref:Uncharacterized protein n=1 Tax=Striga hermonthica TaxID=68872 RepID=A0A9N7N357_STRHE|nr:Unknown protein [Striga hermonthica]